MAGYNWNWSKSEPELRSLYEWLDSERFYVSRKRAGLIAGVVGTYFVAIMCGLAMFLLAEPNANPWLFSGPLFVATMISGIAIAWYIRSTTAEQKEHCRRLGMAHNFMWQLYIARWQGVVKETLGEPSALALNEAAHDYLRCKDAFASPAWRGLGSDSSWAALRSKAELAMQAGLARVVALAGQGGIDHGDEIRLLLDNMRETADEVTATTTKLGGRSGVSGDVSDDLRHVISEMKILNDAHDEVMNLDVRQN